jgi:hypothetical protein
MENEIISLSNIVEWYPDEWILLAYPVREGRHILGGSLIFHSKVKQEIVRQRKEFIFKNIDFEILHTGNLNSLFQEKIDWMNTNIPIMAKKFDVFSIQMIPNPFFLVYSL